jgi:hypothetical protein
MENTILKAFRKELNADIDRKIDAATKKDDEGIHIGDFVKLRKDTYSILSPNKIYRVSFVDGLGLTLRLEWTDDVFYAEHFIKCADPEETPKTTGLTLAECCDCAMAFRMTTKFKRLQWCRSYITVNSRGILMMDCMAAFGISKDDLTATDWEVVKE